MALRIIVKKNDHWGIIDEKNSVILPFNYNAIEKTEHPDYKIFDSRNNESIVQSYDIWKNHSCNSKDYSKVICTQTPFESRIGDKVGLINSLGNEAIPCEYDEFIRVAHYSLLLKSRIKDKYGLIYLSSFSDENAEEKAQELLPCIYEDIIINSSRQYKDDPLHEDICRRHHYDDEYPPPLYQEFESYPDHKTTVLNELVKNPIALLPEDYFFVKYRLNNKWGLLLIDFPVLSRRDPKIFLIFDSVYDKIETVDHYIFATLQHDRWKIQEKMHPVNFSVREQEDGYNPYNLYSFLTKQAVDELKGMEFESVQLYPLGYIVVKKDGKFGLVDYFGMGVKSGFYLIEPQYQNITVKFIGWYGNYCLVLFQYDNYWGFRNLTYNHIELDLEGEVVAVTSSLRNNNLIIYKANGKFGVVDIDMNSYLPCIYNSISIPSKEDPENRQGILTAQLEDEKITFCDLYKFENAETKPIIRRDLLRPPPPKEIIDLPETLDY